MSKELHKQVLDDLSVRKDGWEEKQRLFYEMRHEGVRRQNKPFPTAADLHYPLSDGMIDKLKPFYFQQVFGQEMLADFVNEGEENVDMTVGAARFFDFSVKERSNFFDEMLAMFDLMLMSGVCPVKVRWDQQLDGGSLEYDAIDPLFFVVPPGTIDIEKSDRVTHILQMTVGQYRRNKKFNQDEDFIGRIRGKGLVAEADTGGKTEVKYNREGITYGSTQDEIVLWETYEQRRDGWTVSTYSPQCPDEPARPDFRLPKTFLGLPFVAFAAEVKDKGYYAARGTVEKVAAHEMYLSRVWSEKADSMTWANRPMFTGKAGTTNLGNIRLVPGQYLPGEVQSIKMGEVPFDFDGEMLNTRQMAEYHQAMPDFGLGQQTNQKDSRTKYEVQQTVGMMTQTTDLRGWILRRQLGRLYQKSWSLLKTYGAERLRYLVDEMSQELPAEALQSAYTVRPAGSPDNWNKASRQQRAMQRLQAYGQNPFINLGELTKSCLEEDDPRLVRRLYEDPNVKAADQSEDQAMEICILLQGYPAQVKPADDDTVHLQIVYGKLQQIQQLHLPLEQHALQRLFEHAGQHIQKLAKADKKKAAQFQHMFAAMMGGPQQMPAQQAGAPTSSAPSAALEQPQGGGASAPVAM